MSCGCERNVQQSTSGYLVHVGTWYTILLSSRLCCVSPSPSVFCTALAAQVLQPKFNNVHLNAAECTSFQFCTASDCNCCAAVRGHCGRRRTPNSKPQLQLSAFHVDLCCLAVRSFSCAFMPLSSEHYRTPDASGFRILFN